jgi:hypothetical protein
MRECEGCKCQAPTLYKMPNGQDLCDYCSDAWVKLENTKPVHKEREYSNLQFIIRSVNGTIKNWAESNGFNVGTVNQILSKKGHYNVSDIEVMSLTHLDVLAALESEGYGPLLVAEGYVNN